MWNPMGLIPRTRKPGEPPGTTLYAIESLLPDASGWREDHRTAEHVNWRHPTGDTLSLHRMSGSGDLPLNDPRAMAAMAYGVAESHAGTVISADVVTVAQRPAVQIVYRTDEPGRIRYSGMLVLPLDDHTDTVCVMAEDAGEASEDREVPAHALGRVLHVLSGVRTTWRP